MSLVLATISIGRAAEADEETAPPVVRRNYFDFDTYWSHTFLPHSESHDSIGVAVDRDLSKWVSVGVDAQLYAPFNQNNVLTPASWPASETSWAAMVDAKVFFLRARPHRFTPDVYLMAGIGVIETRPVSVIDPGVRTFSYTPALDFALGVGVRLPINPWLALTIDVRDLIYASVVEDQTIADGTEPFLSRTNPDTWLRVGSTFVEAAQACVGLTLILPGR